MTNTTDTHTQTGLTNHFNPPSAETLHFLKNRRSVVAKNLSEPGPTPTQVTELLEVATRVPDHGKIAPWRFLIFEGEARQDVGRRLAEIFSKDEPEADSDRIDFEANRFLRAPTIIGVISSPNNERPIPVWEQHLSAAAVCQTMLISATAMGFGAQWLTEWYAYHADVMRYLKLEPHEQIAGFIYIGTTRGELKERPRPNVASLTHRWSTR